MIILLLIYIYFLIPDVIFKLKLSFNLLNLFSTGLHYVQQNHTLSKLFFHN